MTDTVISIHDKQLAEKITQLLPVQILLENGEEYNTFLTALFNKDTRFRWAGGQRVPLEFSGDYISLYIKSNSRIVYENWNCLPTDWKRDDYTTVKISFEEDKFELILRWTIDNLKEVCREAEQLYKEPTDKELYDVLRWIEQGHDANEGVSWNTLEIALKQHNIIA